MNMNFPRLAVFGVCVISACAAPISSPVVEGEGTALWQPVEIFSVLAPDKFFPNVPVSVEVTWLEPLVAEEPIDTVNVCAQWDEDLLASEVEVYPQELTENETYSCEPFASLPDVNLQCWTCELAEGAQGNLRPPVNFELQVNSQNIPKVMINAAAVGSGNGTWLTDEKVVEKVEQLYLPLIMR